MSFFDGYKYNQMENQLKTSLKERNIDSWIKTKNGEVMVYYSSPTQKYANELLIDFQVLDKCMLINKCLFDYPELKKYLWAIANELDLSFILSLSLLEGLSSLGLKKYEPQHYTYFVKGATIEQGILFPNYRGTIYYAVLNPEIFIQYRELLKAVDQFALTKKETSKSTVFSLAEYANYPKAIFEIYHAGFDGYILFKKESGTYRPQLFEYQRSKSIEQKIDLDPNLLCVPSNVGGVLEKILKICEKQKKLENLFTPPTRHYDSFAFKYLVAFAEGYSEMKRTIHEHLLNTMDALELEERIVEHEPSIVCYDIDEAWMIKILDHYFIVEYEVVLKDSYRSNKFKEVYSYSNKNEAIDEFNRVINKHEVRKLLENQERLNLLQQEILKI